MFSKGINFLKEVRQELIKVSWSTRQEVIASTAVVIVVTTIMVVFIGTMDLMLSKVLSLIYQ